MHPPAPEPQQRNFLHRASPRLKLAAALLIIIAVTLLPQRPDRLDFVPMVLLLGLWLACRMPLWYTLRRMLVAEFFVLGLALLSFFTPSKAPLFLSAIIKSNLCVFTLLLLTWTTPFSEILLVLRRLRFPTVMLTTLALMYRYLPVLTEESRRMQRARASRTFSRSQRLAWRSLSVIIGQLFVRSAGRAERIYLAMCSRGWK
jgi:cobalt/nickel transport system permease protein